MVAVMFKVPLLLLGALVSACRNHADLVLEILALRQQLAAFASSGRRPRVTNADRWFWIVLRRRWARWSDVLIFVTPETVIRWHRVDFSVLGPGARGYSIIRIPNRAIITPPDQQK